MNSRRLWNLHQRHKFLRAKASRDILKILESWKWHFQWFSTVIFHHTMLFHQNTCKTAGNNTIGMSQAFHNFARFECFTQLNLFKNGFNVIQNWETYALQFYLMVPIFCQQYMVEGDGSSPLKMAN